MVFQKISRLTAWYLASIGTDQPDGHFSSYPNSNPLKPPMGDSNGYARL
jgi:hypothetical protein